MPPPRNTRRTYTERSLQLAIQDINSQQIYTNQRAAAIYNVPRRTLVNRRAGKPPQHDCEPNRKSLTKPEEEAIIQRILKESLRRILLLKAHVRDIANRLLRERSGKPIGKNWVNKFIARIPKLRT
jgi:hypothetical protein